jgi:hypothetical protein
MRERASKIGLDVQKLVLLLLDVQVLLLLDFWVLLGLDVQKLILFLLDVQVLLDLESLSRLLLGTSAGLLGRSIVIAISLLVGLGLSLARGRRLFGSALGDGSTGSVRVPLGLQGGLERVDLLLEAISGATGRVADVLYDMLASSSLHIRDSMITYVVVESGAGLGHDVKETDELVSVLALLQCLGEVHHTSSRSDHPLLVPLSLAMLGMLRS